MNRKQDIDLILRREATLAREKVRAITLRPVNPEGEPVLDGDPQPDIEASGAVHLDIQDIIPTLDAYGMNLPRGIQTAQGVVGNEVWPVSASDVEMEEAGETESLTDQTLRFSNMSTEPRRVSVMINVSNAAIDNAGFDLVRWLREKTNVALRKYLAKKVYSQANWTKNKGPFAGMAAGTIDLGADAYKNILKAVAKFSDKGFFEGDVCISMDRVTEAKLKATPKVAGAAAGFVIENGLCAGYPYTVSHFVNTTLNSADQFVPTADRYFEIGYWEWFALQFHGTVRLIVDGGSAAVAKDNVTKVVTNMEISMTDLSTKINGANSSQAFGLYKIVETEPTEA